MKKQIKDGRVTITLTDGKNLREKKIKRAYLRADEMNNFIMIYTTSQLIDGMRSTLNKQVPPMWESWEKSGIITKEQRKNLKMAHTYMRKFVEGVFADNLDVKTKETVSKKVMKWDLKLIDDFSVQKLYRLLESNKEAHMSMDEFFDLVEGNIVLKCKGCQKNRCDCEFHTFLEERLVPPPTGHGSTLCEYSWNEDKE